MSYIQQLSKMKIDAPLVAALARELNNELAGGRIEKIQQPAKDIVILVINKKKLLLSVRGNYSRIHITQKEYENPKEPPMFCMLLRKHILNALVISISQLNNDRVIEIQLKNTDDIGRALDEKLIIELIPKSSNIILCENNNMIIDCIRRRDFDADMYRRVYPGNIYRLPPKKTDYDGVCTLNSISSELDSYYSNLEIEELLKQKSKDTRTKINSAIKRIEKKLSQQKIELNNTYSREEIKRKADLITANIYRIKPGDSSFICEDFYDDNKLVTINLDPLKSPQGNASKLYKEYNKKKTAEVYLKNLIEKGELQIDYLKSALDELNRAQSEKEITEINDELYEQGFIKSKKSLKRKESPSRPIEDGDLLIGRNNVQNDEITFKIASKTDWWFHVKDYHGAHVILRKEFPNEEDISAACKAAAQHSEVQGNCAVDYCQVKYVKKPKGAFPGKVVYTNYKTRLI